MAADRSAEQTFSLKLERLEAAGALTEPALAEMQPFRGIIEFLFDRLKKELVNDIRQLGRCPRRLQRAFFDNEHFEEKFAKRLFDF